MPTINQLGVDLALSPADQLAVWSNGNGVTRRVPVSALDARYMQPTTSTLLNRATFVAGVGFTPGVSNAVALPSTDYAKQILIVTFDGEVEWDWTLIGDTGLVFDSVIPAGVQEVFVVYLDSVNDLTGSFLQTGPGAVARTYQDKMRDVYSLNDDGLLGDGSDETDKLNAIIAYTAQNGIPLFWPDGKEYGFTNIRALIAGGVFNWIGRPRLKQLPARIASSNAIELGGAILATVALFQTSLSQSNTITLTDASQLLPGDTIRLLTNRLAYGDHRFDPNNSFSQLVKVLAVSGAVATLTNPLVFDFPVGRITSGTAQGGTSGTITLSAADTSTAAALKNYLLTITAGTGAGQARYINSYNATTKVADIGTAYTGFPQAAWTTIPDATSQYLITATVSAQIMRPGFVESLGGMVATGYAQSGVVVYGVQVSFCDSPTIDKCNISGFSNMGLYTYHNYLPKVLGNVFSGANYALAGGGGLGYGHSSLGDFGCVVADNNTDNCRTGFDGINGTMYLLRVGNNVTGGGLAYDGASFWPAAGTYYNSGLSSHTGSFGVTDVGNNICDVWDNKQRGMWQTFNSNTLRGRMNYCVQPSYCTDVTYKDNVYTDGMTVQPTSGINGNVNGDTDAPPVVSVFTNRPQAFANVRLSTLVSEASVTIKGTVAKSLTESLVYVTDCASAPGDMTLSVTDNEASIITVGAMALSVIKHDNSAAPAFGNITVGRNTLHVGGAVLGTIKSDNISKYPIFDAMAITSPLTYQTGDNQWLCFIPQNALAQIPLPAGQTVYRLTIFEKDAAVTNFFSGILQRGSITPILTQGNSAVAFRIDTPSATVGTAGALNIFNRTDSFFINNLGAAAGRFVVLVEGVF